MIQPVGWAEASRNAEAIFARLARPQLGRRRALPGYRARFRHSPLAVSRLADASRDRSATSAPVSTVSRKVTALEERLGVTLLQRTTRKLSLTAQGRAYYNQCSEPLSHLFDAERVLTQTQKKPEGLLRISAPVILGQEAFYAFLSSFMKTYPGIQVDLFVTNLFLDLIVENIDVAIRFGELPEFEPDRPAHRKERALCRGRVGLSARSAFPIASRGPTPASMRSAARAQQRGGMASGQRQEIHQTTRLRTGGGERFPCSERFHLSRPRHWPAAIDLLRCSDR